MNAQEKGFLLLTAKLGNPDRKCLTAAQFRELALRVREREIDDPDRQLCQEDLYALGYGAEMANRIVSLLSEEAEVKKYIYAGVRKQCHVTTRISTEYPPILRAKLGQNAPACLWMRGDLDILDTPAIALVGSRELSEENRRFAREVGYQAACQGYTLISGNARGADREAQESCLAQGGKVISVVSDSLLDKPKQKNLLYLSEEGYDLPFSVRRALSRNRLIHALPTHGVFVAQCDLHTGGTWDGTEKNLKNNWSTVYCFEDQSPAQVELCRRGAEAVRLSDLGDIYALQTKTPSLF